MVDKKKKQVNLLWENEKTLNKIKRTNQKKGRGLIPLSLFFYHYGQRILTLLKCEMNLTKHINHRDYGDSLVNKRSQ